MNCVHGSASGSFAAWTCHSGFMLGEQKLNPSPYSDEQHPPYLVKQLIHVGCWIGHAAAKASQIACL